MSINNELQIRNNEMAFTADDVKKYICPNATDSEFFMLMQIVKERELNPFLNEVYFIKYGTGKAQIIVGKDAILKRAKKINSYRGFKSGWFDKTGKKLEFPIGDIVGAWCEVYADNREPLMVAVTLKEYSTGKSTWNEKPLTMIQKVAIAQAHRSFAPEETSGMYEQEEMDKVIHANEKDITPIKSAKVEPTNEPKTIDHKKQLTKFFLANGITDKTLQVDIVHIISSNPGNITDKDCEMVFGELIADKTLLQTTIDSIRPPIEPDFNKLKQATNPIEPVNTNDPLNQFNEMAGNEPIQQNIMSQISDIPEFKPTKENMIQYMNQKGFEDDSVKLKLINQILGKMKESDKVKTIELVSPSEWKKVHTKMQQQQANINNEVKL